MDLPEWLLVIALILVFLAITFEVTVKKRFWGREDWQFINPPNCFEKERAADLRRAGFDSLEQFTDLCKNLHAFNHRRFKVLGEKEKFPSADYQTRVRIIAEGRFIEKIYFFYPEMPDHKRGTPLARLYTMVDFEAAAVYNQLRLLKPSLSKLMEQDRLNLLYGLFGKRGYRRLKKKIGFEIQEISCYIDGPYLGRDASLVSRPTSETTSSKEPPG